MTNHYNRKIKTRPLFNIESGECFGSNKLFHPQVLIIFTDGSHNRHQIGGNT
jgi:hypothetical protein